MRNCFAFLMCLYSHAALSQLIIKANLLYPALVNGASVAVEVATPGRTSLNFYGAFGSSGRLVLAKEYTFQNLIVERRMYVASSIVALQGSYIAPYAKYMHRKIYRDGVSHPIISVGGRDSDGHSVGLGVALGRQIRSRYVKRTVVDAFAGVGYLLYVSETDYSNPGESRLGHVDLRVGLSMGYRL